MAHTVYYNGIAKQWSRATGHHGGALKRYVLNERILARIAGVAVRALLELGAGNGYFLPLLLRRFSGQLPRRVVVSDQSTVLLRIAETEFAVPGAEYLALDVQAPFPFADASFDLILATMLFNELPTSYLARALAECRRVLAPGGQLLASVPHPAFVHALARRGALTQFGRGLWAMPSAEGLRLPVARRSLEAYAALVAQSGFTATSEDVWPNDQVLHAKPGLTVGRRVPLALVLDCRRD
jgi:SAM-dependent methyltransferase